MVMIKNFLETESKKEIHEILLKLIELTENKKIYWYIENDMTKIIAYLSHYEIIISNNGLVIKNERNNFIKLVISDEILSDYELEINKLFEIIKKSHLSNFLQKIHKDFMSYS